LANINFIVKNDIELKGNLIFEGATKDAYETTLTITDPTADRTITFPNSTGTAALTSDITKSAVGLGNVENTALSTWAGSTNITTLGAVSATSINSTPIGATTASTGRFTSVGIESNAAVIDVFSSATSPLNDDALTTNFPAAEYIVYARTSTGRYTSKVMLLWDGSTTPTITEYGILSTGTITVTVTAVTNTGQLNVAVSGGTLAQIRLVRTAVAL
jgi:hypothetical protein